MRTRRSRTSSEALTPVPKSNACGMNRRLSGWSLLLLTIGALHCPGANAGPQQSFAEPKIKAALLYNFAKFVEWPPVESKGPLVIGVLGEDDELFKALAELVEGKTIGDSVVATKRFKTLRELQLCHVLFVDLSDDAKVRTALEVVSAGAVLTVGDGKRFPREGGMIGIYFDEGKARFDINNGAARKSGLRIRAQLLQLAQAVSP